MSSIKSENHKYFSNTAWNMISFGIQAICGGVINLGLAFFVGASGLGVFNQLYAIFMISGQLFAFGLHDSAQKHFAFSDDQTNDFWAIFLSVIGTGMLGFFSLLISSFLLKNLVKSEAVQQGVYWLAFGIPFFAVNKVLLGIMNGKSQMKHFAIIQMTRVILITVTTFIITFSKLRYSFFALPFIVSEAIIFCLLIPHMLRLFPFVSDIKILKNKIKYHLIFGIKSLPHGFLVETFIRVDVLVLSFFMSDEQIGIYSFVAFFFEGIFQVPYLIRSITNPLLVPVILKKNYLELIKIFKRSLITSGLITCVISIICILLFPLILGFFPNIPLKIALPVLQILLMGLMIHSFLSPFDNFLLLGGKPAQQSLYMIGMASLNIILNFILIPKLGLAGAAWATASSFILCGPCIMIISYYSFDIRHWNSIENSKS